VNVINGEIAGLRGIYLNRSINLNKKNIHIRQRNKPWTDKEIYTTEQNSFSKLTVIPQVKMFLAFAALWCSEGLATGPYVQSVETNRHSHILFL
jgi:hypothetical protein